MQAEGSPAHAKPIGCSTTAVAAEIQKAIAVRFAVPVKAVVGNSVVVAEKERRFAEEEEEEEAHANPPASPFQYLDFPRSAMDFVVAAVHP